MSAPRSNVLRELVRASRHAPSLRRGLAASLTLALLAATGQVVVPIAIQQVLDREVLDGGPIDLTLVTAAVVGALTALALSYVANRVALRRLLVSATDGLTELRVAAFRHIHRLSVLHVQAERRGALVSRVTSDIEVLTEFLEWGGVGMIVGGTQIGLSLVVMLVYEWRLALLVLAGAVCYGGGLLLAQRVLRRANDRVRVHVSESLAAVSEAVVGLPTIRAFGAEQRSLDRVAGALQRQYRSQFRTAALGAALFSSAELFAASLTAAVVIVGVLVAGAGSGLTAGMLVAFLFLLTLFVDPVQTLVEVADQAQTAAAGVRRVLEILDTEVDVADPRDPEALRPGPLEVRFEAVSFGYPTSTGPVLRDVTVRLPAGHRVAVVGETGSGKSTFAKLLVRLLDPTAGTIALSGVPVDRISFDVLRRRVAFVPQEGFLFEGTVADNLRYGRPGAATAELEASVDELGLRPWVEDLPAGLHTPVGERGGRLSAGERQLVALLRAWLVSPDLLVLDEATSAVDPALEVRLRRAIDRLTAGRTSVTVAHRLSTAESADEVLVFDRGRLVERGTHATLLAAGGRYAALWRDWERATVTESPADA